MKETQAVFQGKQVIFAAQKDAGRITRVAVSEHIRGGIRLSDRTGTHRNETHQQNITNAVRIHLLAPCYEN